MRADAGIHEQGGSFTRLGPGAGGASVKAAFRYKPDAQAKGTSPLRLRVLKLRCAGVVFRFGVRRSSPLWYLLSARQTLPRQKKKYQSGDDRRTPN